MLTNWVYSLFYVSSELWGDVILSLLFWGMANETTRLQDASIIYPLLGVGANMAQASSGAITRWVSGVWQPAVPANEVWAVKLRFLMSIVMLCGVASPPRTRGSCTGRTRRTAVRGKKPRGLRRWRRVRRTRRRRRRTRRDRRREEAQEGEDGSL